MKGKIRSIVEAYAASVIKSVMDEFGIGAEDFQRSNVNQCVKARRRAIRRLHADGFSINEIARVMCFNESTVRYWIDPKARARKIASSRKIAAALSRSKTQNAEVRL